jgi:hypothetical protein
MSPDITMCSGEGCTKKESCYRFVAVADDYQSFFVSPPIKEGECENYWKTDLRKGIPRVRDEIASSR